MFWRKIVIAVGAAGLMAAALAQFNARRPRNYGDRPVDRGNIPIWPVNASYPDDLFTFARLRYPSTYERQSLAWYTDYADADLNLSYRLHELTALYVHPDPALIGISEDELRNHPWLFMSGVGNIQLDDDEARILRNYLLGGGFIMVDDFWGEQQWNNFYRALKQIFPDREPVDLDRSHPIFHCVYDIPNDKPLQTPNIYFAMSNRESGITWESPDARDVHFRAILDDRGRIMVMICHNTDNGDGWEEEGSDAWFFHEFSENKNYPLAINIVFYSMTH